MNSSTATKPTLASRPDVVLFLLCITELSFISYARNIFGPYISPIVLLMISASVAIYYLVYSCSAEVESQTKQYASTVNRLIKGMQITAFFVMLLYILYSLTVLWNGYTIHINDVSRSDVIPQIMFMVKRNWAGTNPYAPITWGQNTLSPTYLPFQWLPYTAAELLHKDYRWIPALAMTGAATYFFFNNLRKIDAGIQNVWQLLIPLYHL